MQNLGRAVMGVIVNHHITSCALDAMRNNLTGDSVVRPTMSANFTAAEITSHGRTLLVELSLGRQKYQSAAEVSL